MASKKEKMKKFIESELIRYLSSAEPSVDVVVTMLGNVFATLEKEHNFYTTRFKIDFPDDNLPIVDIDGSSKKPSRNGKEWSSEGISDMVTEFFTAVSRAASFMITSFEFEIGKTPKFGIQTLKNHTAYNLLEPVKAEKEVFDNYGTNLIPNVSPDWFQQEDLGMPTFNEVDKISRDIVHEKRMRGVDKSPDVDWRKFFPNLKSGNLKDKGVIDDSKLNADPRIGELFGDNPEQKVVSPADQEKIIAVNEAYETIRSMDQGQKQQLQFLMANNV